ncbi:M1 family metallopeptidase [Limosilactobacillus secaliphilus]|uniref:Aminopeptidase n=1 Tax=Limosilactobacillus secaliphilus TaxID=396268 RepID=A0A0R2I2W5_9LACO|nr:M1 family metallopeptidase [Limosilactobacillus secaliphilus]KRN59609.1 peptidase M1 membrane alanine aminopeptidase [Limosilactobacillus secaliphilus]
MSKRLLDDFVPKNYQIFVDINRANKTIEGQVTMTGHANQTQVAVNQKFLKIDSVQVDGNDVDYQVDDDNEKVDITLPAAGDTTVVIKYHTALTDTMMGIYPSYYQLNGQKQELIGTQFETTFARQAFPLIDEPAAKATFDMAIKFDEKPGETIIANMPEDHEKDGVHYFQQTLRISPYLVAFAFGDMQKKLTETKSGVQIGVFATKAHKPKELDLALDIAKRAIEFYEDFYQTPYPLPHSYQLALPDFSAGAMENWGLVTYRESYMLLDPDNATLPQKEHVATTVTHELAHQWFGDLVTMNWWDDLWLNESFANMMEYVCVDHLEPDWKIWETFQTSEVPMALQRDAIDGVQSVHVEVEDPADISSIFDSAIVYAKGSRMLVMVRSLLGDDNLRKGLKLYFDEHKYHNAKGDDLWNALSKASGMDIGAIMHSWLNQPGFPVVSVMVENGHLKLHQEQFFIGEHEDKGRLWQIPLNANYDAAPTIMKDADLDLGDYQDLRQKNGKPFRLNVGNNSHFIVKYDQTLLDDIMAHKDDLDNIAQLQLLQDLRLLAEGGQTNYAGLVDLLPKFAQSKSYIVNSGLYQIANSLKHFVDPNGQTGANLRQLFTQLSESQAARLGWDTKSSEGIDDQLTRPYVLRAALYAQNADAEKIAHQLFTENGDNLSALSAAIRPLVLDNEMEHYGNADLLAKLLKLYQESTDPAFKMDLANAMCMAQDPDLIKQVISQFEQTDVIKPQDIRYWYHFILDNPTAKPIAWDWFRDQWDWLWERLGGDMEFSRFINDTASAFYTPAELNEYKDFFGPKESVPGLGRDIKMDIRIIAGRAKLIDSEKDAVNSAVAKLVH